MQFVLLDDILSAVDAHTSRHLLHQVLQGPLVANRTIILVTHHVELVLPAASFLVELDAGKLVRAESRTPVEFEGVDSDSEDEVEVEVVEREAKDGGIEKEGWSTGVVEHSVYQTSVPFIHSDIRASG